MSIAWEAAALTDVGRVRSGNEDAFRLDPLRGVFLVADGMGGHAAGEVASALAADSVAAALAEGVEAGAPDAAWEGIMEAAFDAAHRLVRQHCREHPQTHGMGTTVTACVLGARGTLHVAHVGDSRLYRLREGRLQQLTRDHTWVEREIAAGRLPPTARVDHPLSHILTRVLSDDTPPAPDFLQLEARAGDLLLLTTDGLTGMLPDPEIAAVVADDGVPLPQRLQALITAANRAGGVDNVTALAVRVLRAA